MSRQWAFGFHRVYRGGGGAGFLETPPPHRARWQPFQPVEIAHRVCQIRWQGFDSSFPALLV